MNTVDGWRFTILIGFIGVGIGTLMRIASTLDSILKAVAK